MRLYFDDLISSNGTLRELPPISPELQSLLDQVVQSSGTPADIDTWAALLANDIKDLTD